MYQKVAHNLTGDWMNHLYATSIMCELQLITSKTHIM